MTSWNANVVRIALNQDFWLPGSALSDPNYPALVDDAITWAEMAGMDVFLDLHWSDRGVLGSCPPSAGCQQLMPDANSLTFWSQVAARYQNDGRVAFELYNEPHDVGWDVWRNGGTTFQGWQAVGMQQLYDAVRATGAQNLVVIGGLDWAYDLSGVPANRINGYNIVYATHPYTSTDRTLRPPSDWDRAFGSLTGTDPVVATEFGVLNDTACTTDYDSQLIQYADAHLAGWTDAADELHLAGAVGMMALFHGDGSGNRGFTDDVGDDEGDEASGQADEQTAHEQTAPPWRDRLVAGEAEQVPAVVEELVHAGSRRSGRSPPARADEVQDRQGEETTRTRPRRDLAEWDDRQGGRLDHARGVSPMSGRTCGNDAVPVGIDVTTGSWLPPGRADHMARLRRTLTGSPTVTMDAPDTRVRPEPVWTEGSAHECPRRTRMTVRLSC